MILTAEEQSMLDGARGVAIAEAMDYIVQFGEAFDAERLVDIAYCHYGAEMAIYKGNVEEVVEYAGKGARVAVPTTSTTLCADIERPEITGIPIRLAEKQARVIGAHRSMGIMDTYTCTPQQLGFIPPFGSYAALTESSAIIYYNSVLGVRANRGGPLTRYAAITGKYPLMGYLLDENRKGTHHFRVNIAEARLRSVDAWSALGLHIGKIVGSGVPVIDGITTDKQECMLALGATLATTGSVTLFHLVGVTPEARTLKEAFQGDVPAERVDVTTEDLDGVYRDRTNLSPGAPIDFVTLGCPHFTLTQIQQIAALLEGKKVAEGVRFWICTNRMTRKQAEGSGYVEVIERTGARVVADTCPVESHMRVSTCRDYGLPIPNVKAMVTNSGKMNRYVADLIGCRVALSPLEKCIESALSGKYVS